MATFKEFVKKGLVAAGISAAITLGTHPPTAQAENQAFNPPQASALIEQANQDEGGINPAVPLAVGAGIAGATILLAVSIEAYKRKREETLGLPLKGTDLRNYNRRDLNRLALLSRQVRDDTEPYSEHYSDLRELHNRAAKTFETITALLTNMANSDRFRDFLEQARRWTVK